MLLKAKMWLIVHIPLIWILWMAHLYRKYRKVSWRVGINEARVNWEYWNMAFKPNARFTPLQVYNMMINDLDLNTL